MTMKQLLQDEERLSAMKELLVQMHPSNFPGNEDAQNIYEDMQTFYERAAENISEESSKQSRRRKKNHPRTSPTTVIESVVQFNVRQKWPWLDGYLRPLSPIHLTSGKVLAPLVAYQCINLRGAIAHGKRPSLIYSWENVETCKGQSVMDTLMKHGGFKTINGSKVDEIKVEIINNGPVISFSFIPTTAFAQEHSESIIKSRIKKHHYCLIIGWKLTEYGEVWLVQSYNGTEIFQVPVGRYTIEETILAPKDNYLHVTWQQGPYYDKDMMNFNGWSNYEDIALILKTHELEELVEIFGDKPFHEVIVEKTRFVIRDKKKHAHSRSCSLTSLNWDKESKTWQAQCTFNDKGSQPMLDDDLA